MDFKGFLEQFHKRTGYDFSEYTENSLSRRIDDLQKELNLSLEQILEKSTTDKVFLNQVVEDITVNTTELFRDPQVWISLYKSLYKNLPKTKFTIWHVGCSVGLEVYSDLIMLSELGILGNARVIGTDINERVLEVARKGKYAYKFNIYFEKNFNIVMQGIGSESTFDDYFDIDEKNDTMQVKPFLQKVPIFARQNLVEAKAPFAYKVDAVFFRNVMIYFNNKLQQKILTMIHSKMYDGAALIFGKRESLPMTMNNRFRYVGQYYQKQTI